MGYQLSRDSAKQLSRELRNKTLVGGTSAINHRQDVPPQGPFFMTPSGGIPAASGTDPLTLGVADCKMCELWRDGTTWKVRTITPEITEKVYNSEKSAIAGSAIIQTKNRDGLNFIDVGKCA